MLITFSGLDGAGKTTQIELFTRYLKENKYKVKVLRMYDDISSSALLRKVIGNILRKTSSSSALQNPTGFRNDKNRKEPGLIILRKIAYAADLLIFLFKRVHYQYLKKNILIMDRYLYDSAANLFKAYSDRYIGFFLNLIPKPDLALFIDVAPSIAFKRKPEYHRGFYTERRTAYKHIFKNLKHISIVNSESIDSTQLEIRQLFKKASFGKICTDDSFFYIDLIFRTLFNNKATGNIPVLMRSIDFDKFISVLDKNRITVRWIKNNIALFDKIYRQETSMILKNESCRLNKAIDLIGRVTEEFQNSGLPIIVIKTLDNYPDLGHDVDLYTQATIKQIDDILLKKFNAKLEKPTVSERLNKKRNYKVPGNTTLEIHCGTLGQLGEDVLLSADLIPNSKSIEVQGAGACIPAAEYRLLLTVLQRIYRHFNIRICDFYNTVELIRNKSLDFNYLKEISMKYGIWEGVMLYLCYVDKLAKHYGLCLDLEQHLEGRNWPDFITIKNMHFRFSLVNTGLNVYSKRIGFEISKLNLYSLSRLMLFFPLSLAHYFSVKLFRKSKIW